MFSWDTSSVRGWQSSNHQTWTPRQNKVLFGCVMLGYHSLGKSSILSVFSKESWDDAVSGKTVFVKFFAPWSPGRKGPKGYGGRSFEHWTYFVLKTSLSTSFNHFIGYTVMLIYFRVAMNDTRFHPLSTGVATARRWSPYLGADMNLPRVSSRVIKFQTRTSVNLSGMQMIFIRQIMDHSSIEYDNVCLKDWDKLMKEFEGSSNILVADVDCIGSGKSKWPAAKNGKTWW